MKASLIIPVYNVEPYIERCLLSALNQTYEDIEIILVDDCGQDKSMEIANQVIQNHKNGHKTTVLKHHRNQGLSEARNTGIKAATGDYVYFLDSDDEIFLYTIETLVDLAIKYNPDLVIGNVSATNAVIDYSLKIKDMEFIEGNTKILSLFSQSKWSEMACNRLINREFIIRNDLRFYTGIYHEDVLWSFQLTAKTNSIAISFVPTYIYHIRENSISQNQIKKNMDDLVFITKQIRCIIQSNKNCIDNIDVLVYYENLKFGVLMRAGNTLFWISVYNSLKNLFLIKPVLFYEIPFKIIVKIVIVWALPQKVLKKVLQKFNF
jgi:glycosyltransferase involved in cell wall biosynthesis